MVARKSNKRSLRPVVRDDADQALWSLFTSSAHRASTKIRSDKDVYLRYNRDKFLREMEESQSHVWIKLLGPTLNVLNSSNIDHHSTTVQAALQLLNNMCQPICSSAQKIMKAAVQQDLVPILVNLISQLDTSSSKTMELACHLLRRIASVPKHRERMSTCIPALLKIVRKRPNQLVVDSALSSLQNLSVNAQFANTILQSNGVETICHVLLDRTCVEAGCNTLANLAAHKPLRRKVAVGNDTLEILLHLIQSPKLSAWMQMKAAYALHNIVTGETASCKECSKLGGALALENLFQRLQPRSDMTGVEQEQEEYLDEHGDIRLLSGRHPNGTQTPKKSILKATNQQPNETLALNVKHNDTNAGATLLKQRKKPREPKWFANLLLRLKQCGRAMRRGLILVNDFAEEGRLGLSNRTTATTNTSAQATANTYVRALEATGFECTSRTNTSKKQVVQVIQSFLQSLRKGDVVMLVFVGHGVSYRGENHLFPTDFPVLGRQIDVHTHAISLTKLAKQCTNKIGESGLLLCSLEASPTTNGGGEKFDPIVPMDVANFSSHNNVCVMVSTMRPVNAEEGSTLSKKTLMGKAAGGLGGSTIFVRDQRLLEYQQTTAFSYEMCVALVSENMEASSIIHEVRRTLVDHLPDPSYEENVKHRRLPWCNSSMVADFYFNETTTNVKTGQKEQRNHNRTNNTNNTNNTRSRKNSTSLGKSNKSRSGSHGSWGGFSNNSTNKIRPPLHQPSPPPRPPQPTARASNKLNASSHTPRTPRTPRSPRSPRTPKASIHTSTSNGGLNNKKTKKPTFGNQAEDTAYSLNRSSQYMDMVGTSRRVNMTDFVAAQATFGAGADVAGAARWTSTLRSGGGGGSGSHLGGSGFLLGGGRGGNSFHTVKSLNVQESEYDEYDPYRPNEYDATTVGAPNRNTGPRPGTCSPRKLQALGDSSLNNRSGKSCNHNWVISRFGLMECRMCGLEEGLEYSQSVFAPSSSGGGTPS